MRKSGLILLNILFATLGIKSTSEVHRCSYWDVVISGMFSLIEPRERMLCLELMRCILLV